MTALLAKTRRVFLTCAVGLHVLSCGGTERAASTRGTPGADAGTNAAPARDAGRVGPATAPPDDVPTRRDGGSSIDCAKAGGSERRESGFLGGVFTARISLESWCATFECPYRSIDDFLAFYSCSSVGAGDAGGAAVSFSEMPLTEGCGLEIVGGMGPFGGTEYLFDAATGVLVGASMGSDGLFGPCNTAIYTAGRVSTACDDATLYRCQEIRPPEPVRPVECLGGGYTCDAGEVTYWRLGSAVPDGKGDPCRSIVYRCPEGCITESHGLPGVDVADPKSLCR